MSRSQIKKMFQGYSLCKMLLRGQQRRRLDFWVWQDGGLMWQYSFSEFLGKKACRQWVHEKMWGEEKKTISIVYTSEQFCYKMEKIHNQILADVLWNNGSRHFVLFLIKHIMVGLHSEGHNTVEKDKMMTQERVQLISEVKFLHRWQGKIQWTSVAISLIRM